jgi:hypothetical protein
MGIRALPSFHEFVFVESHGDWTWDKWLAEWKIRHAAMLVAMRQDALIQATDIAADELAGRLPWYTDWDILEKSQQEIPTGSSAESPAEDK